MANVTITGKDGHAYVIAPDAEAAARILTAEESELETSTAASDMRQAESTDMALVSGLRDETIALIVSAHERGELWVRA